MSDSEMEPALPRPRCLDCADVIGAYEPMVLETPHGPRHTSLAAEPDLYGSADRCFHCACYLRQASTSFDSTWFARYRLGDDCGCAGDAVARECEHQPFKE